MRIRAHLPHRTKLCFFARMSLFYQVNHRVTKIGQGRAGTAVALDFGALCRRLSLSSWRVFGRIFSFSFNADFSPFFGFLFFCFTFFCFYWHYFVERFFFLRFYFIVLIRIFVIIGILFVFLLLVCHILLLLIYSLYS